MKRAKTPTPFTGAGLILLFVSVMACDSANELDAPSNRVREPRGESGAPSFGAGGSVTAAGARPAGAGGALVGCDPPGHQTPVSTLQLATFSVRLVDPLGSHLPDTPALICGKDVCSLVTTDGSGRIDKTFSPPLQGDAIALKTGDGIRFAEFVLPIEESTADLGDQVMFPFPDATSGTVPAPDTAVESNGVSLVVTRGASVEIDPIVYTRAVDQQFRAVVVAPTEFPDAVDGGEGFGLVVAVRPVDARICPPARLSVPNVPGWAPNAEVEVFLHGVSISEAYAPYGGWAELTRGVVDADGKTVTTTAGVPVLGTFGFRLSE
jgi:hypothetical protein